jgi:hypothetical protein
MKLLIELNIEKKTTKIIETVDLTVDDICKIICEYFGLSMYLITKRPLNKSRYYALARKFISLFLYTELKTPYKVIASKLNYTEGEEGINFSEKSMGAISYNISTVQKQLDLNNIIYVRPYNNISKLIMLSTKK